MPPCAGVFGQQNSSFPVSWTGLAWRKTPDWGGVTSYLSCFIDFIDCATIQKNSVIARGRFSCNAGMSSWSTGQRVCQYRVCVVGIGGGAETGQWLLPLRGGRCGSRQCLGCIVYIFTLPLSIGRLCSGRRNLDGGGISVHRICRIQAGDNRTAGELFLDGVRLLDSHVRRLMDSHVRRLIRVMRSN